MLCIRKLACALLTLGFFASATPAAEPMGILRAFPGDTTAGLVTITNPTDKTIHYQFRWGAGEWKVFSLSPGCQRRHWWNYDFRGENRSPVPQIRFDWIGGDGKVTYHTVRLTAYAVVNPRVNTGKVYRFRYSSGGSLIFLNAVN